MATMVGRCEVGGDNEYANNEMFLGCFGQLCVSRHETPLSRPLTKLSIDTLDTRAASNWVHIYNPNFRLAFTNSVAEMNPFACQTINDGNWLKKGCAWSNLSRRPTARTCGCIPRSEGGCCTGRCLTLRGIIGCCGRRCEWQCHAAGTTLPKGRRNLQPEG